MTEPVATDIDGRTWVRGPFAPRDGLPFTPHKHDCARNRCDDSWGCLGAGGTSMHPVSFQDWVWQRMSQQCRDWGLSDAERDALLRLLP